MFKAIGRWFKALTYLLTGQIDAARRTLDTNPHVVRATYDKIAREKVARIQQYKQAVAGLIAQQENKLNLIKNLTTDVERLERLKAGALAKAKQRVGDLKKRDLPAAAIHSDPEYKKCLSAFNDFSSTLTEKQARIEGTEIDIKDYDLRIKEHKVQLQELAREVNEVKTEAADAVADIITAQQEKDLADAFAGLGEDTTEAELQRMRKLRSEVKAEARISKELAGTDNKSQEMEFMEYARSTQANDEFDSLIGLADETEVAAAAETEEEEAPLEEQQDSTLPE